MNLLDLIKSAMELADDRASAAVLRERLALIQDKAAALQEKVAQLEQENSALRKQVAELTEHARRQVEAEEFVEHRGALFKRKAAGGYHLAVYCPGCRRPMFSLMGDIHYACNACGILAQFNEHQLEQVMSELP